MKALFSIVVVLCTVITGCKTVPAHRPEFSGTMPIEDCPETLQGRVRLSAQVLDLSTPLHAATNSVPTVGALSRRIVVSATPTALDPGDRITWSVLSVNTSGGTFVDWTRLVTDHVELGSAPHSQPLPLRESTRRTELATVTFAPGQIKVIRTAVAKVDLAGAMTLDVIVMPGGVMVDNTAMRIPQLWAPDNTPLPPADVDVEFSPIRHPPGLDIVEGAMELNFVIHQARTGDEWNCSAQTRLAIVDEDDIRLPLWDLGLASTNAGRKVWLAVWSPSLGAVRIIFGSFAEANSLANWIRSTGATTLGDYTLGVFQQTRSSKGPAFSPVDAEALRTFRPLTAADIHSIKAGALGEP